MPPPAFTGRPIRDWTPDQYIPSPGLLPRPSPSWVLPKLTPLCYPLPSFLSKSPPTPHLNLSAPSLPRPFPHPEDGPKEEGPRGFRKQPCWVFPKNGIPSTSRRQRVSS